MKIKVLFFASCQEVTGVDKVEMEADEKTRVCDLVESVVKKYPKLEKMLGNMVLSVNLEYTDPKSKNQLKSTDEVAFIPPISGG
mmetsp:Transcript_9946/g.14935  ORF Transcript_9946/g.14935 Transcript_9946/m.14935 type:complete len:84 (+) Transcript_9946:32-283(+)